LASRAASFGSGRRRSWFGESEFRSGIFRPLRNAELRSARVPRPRRNRRPKVSLIRLVSALLQATSRLIKESLMPGRRKYRFTIRQLRVATAIAGTILGLFAAYPNDPGAVMGFLISFLVMVIPVHLAIEGNRHDPIVTGINRRDHPDQGDSAGLD
jgi:hypothetical protein